MSYNIMKQNKTLLLFFIFIFSLSFTSALLGTYKQSSDIDLVVTCNNCTYCNYTSIKYPNGTNIFKEVETTKLGTEYNYTLNSSHTENLGTYIYCYQCGNDFDTASDCIEFDVTLSGNETPESVSYIYLGIIFLFFGTCGIFLYLTYKIEYIGFKIFFLLMSFVFLIGSIATASIVATDSNLTEGVNTSITVMLFSVGLIFFVLFAYVMIEQTRTILDLMRERKGYETY